MKREEIIISSIEEIRAGKRSLEESVTEHPELRDELVELAALASQIGREPVMPSAEFKQRARNRLQAVMASTTTKRKPARHGFNFRFTARLGYAIVTACLVLTLSGGTVFASQSSLPGQTLYPVKTGLENVQINLATSPESKTRLHLKFTERRVQEVVRESESGRDISAAALEAMADQMNHAIEGMNETQSDAARALLSQFAQSASGQQVSLEQVSKVAPEAAQAALKQAIDAARRGTLIAQIAGDNPSFLKTGASVLDDELESDFFELEGTLLGVNGQTWNVGGIQLSNINVPQTPPGVGSTIKLKGVAGDNETFTSKIESHENTPGETVLKGVFSGTQAGGAIWIIGGIPVSGFQNITPPQPGSRMEIKGNFKDGVFSPRQEIQQKEPGSEEADKQDESRDSSVSSEDDRDSPADSGLGTPENGDSPSDTGVSTEDNQDAPEESATDEGENQDSPGDSEDRSLENRDKSGDSNSSSGENRYRSRGSREGSGDSRD